MIINIRNIADAPATATAGISKRDSRCMGWAKLLRNADPLPCPEDIEGANSINKPYLKQSGRDTTVELAPGDAVIMGEAIHHRKMRGWFYKVGLYSISGEVHWVVPTAEIKAKIKLAIKQKNREKNGTFDWLMGGAGDVAAMVRIVLAQRSGIEIFDDYIEISVEPSAEPELEDLVFS